MMGTNVLIYSMRQLEEEAEYKEEPKSPKMCLSIKYSNSTFTPIFNHRSPAVVVWEKIIKNKIILVITNKYMESTYMHHPFVGRK